MEEPRANVSLHSLRLRFVQSAGSSTISSRQLWRTLSTFTTSSYETAYGIGSDAGRFLYWLGERAIDGFMEVKIRARLSSIQRRLARRSTVNMGLEGEKALRDAYADLVRLCGEDFPPRIKLRALHLLAEAIRPLDACSMVLLRSNFTDLLAACQLELCEDWRVNDMADCLAKMVSAFQELPCKCSVCLRALKVSFDPTPPLPELLYKIEAADNQDVLIGTMYIHNGFFAAAHRGQI